MSDIVVALLGSSVLSVMITSLFNWAQNRRSNTKNYMAEERKRRRDDIRDIIVGVDDSVYGGKGKRNIERYLVCLEMNINPYGRYQKYSYLLDSHLWIVIEEIRQADNEEVFNQKKKLLSGYLCLLLKEDWEKMKREVNGYSNAICNIGLIGVTAIVYSLFYLYVLKLDDIMMLLIMLFFNCSPLLFTKIYVIDELDSMESNNKSISINAIMKRNKKERKIFRNYFIYIIVFLLVNLFMVETVYPRMIVENIVYEVKEDTTYIYTKLDSKLWIQLEEQIHMSMEEKEVIIKENQNILPDKNEREKETDEIIIKALKKSMSSLNSILVAWLAIIIMVQIFFAFSAATKSKRMEREIQRLSHNINIRDEELYSQLAKITVRVDYDAAHSEEDNKDYLGLLYVVLEQLGTKLKKEVFDLEGDIGNVELLEKMKGKKSCLSDVERALKVIEEINKAKKIEDRKVKFVELKQQIDKIVEKGT